MRLSLTLLLFLVAGLINPISTSLSGPPEDFEGSGYDLDSSGSGSGEESEREENGNVQNQPDSEDGVSFEDSVPTFDSVLFPERNRESELVLLGKNKSFLDNKDALTAVIAGGAIGGTLAAAVTAIMIYRWLKKDREEQSQGLWKTSNEGYQKPIREEYIV